MRSRSVSTKGNANLSGECGLRCARLMIEACDQQINIANKNRYDERAPSVSRGLGKPRWMLWRPLISRNIVPSLNGCSRNSLSVRINDIAMYRCRSREGTHKPERGKDSGREQFLCHLTRKR